MKGLCLFFLGVITGQLALLFFMGARVRSWRDEG